MMLCSISVIGRGFAIGRPAPPSSLSIIGKTRFGLISIAAMPSNGLKEMAA